MRSLLFTFYWPIRTAFRTSRRSRLQLAFLFSLLALGSGIIIGLTAFYANVEEALRNQQKIVLGADAVVVKRSALPKGDLDFLLPLTSNKASEVTFTSMVYFPGGGTSRLVQVNAVGSGYPYYGSFSTEPLNRRGELDGGGKAILEPSVLMQLGLVVGDSVRIGEREFEVIAALKKAPGSFDLQSVLAPRVYISVNDLESTNLLKRGSRVIYKTYFKFKENVSAEKVAERFRDEFSRRNLQFETPQSRSGRFREVLEKGERFIALVAFVSLLLGGLAFCSGLSIFLHEKRREVSLLRCLGASTVKASFVYILQLLAFAGLASLVGLLIGALVQYELPILFKAILPLEVQPFWPWKLIAFHLAGSFICFFLFVLGPVSSLRKATALGALRELPDAKRDYTSLLSILLVFALLYLYAIKRTSSPVVISLFLLATLVTLLVLTLLALLLRKLALRVGQWSFSGVIRYGVAALYRPKNQTLLLMLSIGVTSFLSGAVLLLHESLAEYIAARERANLGNMIIFDIQEHQLAEVKEEATSRGMPVVDLSPIVTMRLASLKGESIEVLRGRNEGIPEWSLLREYRSTYRSTLTGGEEVLAGSFPVTTPGPNGATPVSVEEGIAEKLKLKLNDLFSVDIQGRELACYVSSIRRVDWYRVQPNFFLVFPEGALSEDYTTFVLLTQAPSEEAIGLFQRDIVRSQPNLSMIDLTLVLRTLNTLFSAVQALVYVLLSFSLAMALLVLIALIASSRGERVKEVLLLKTLGASQRQTQIMLSLEYLFLALLSVLAGTILATAGAFALTKSILKLPFVFPLPLLALLGVTIIAVTFVVGLATNLGIYHKQAAAILREGS